MKWKGKWDQDHEELARLESWLYHESIKKSMKVLCRELTWSNLSQGNKIGDNEKYGNYLNSLEQRERERNRYLGKREDNGLENLCSRTERFGDMVNAGVRKRKRQKDWSFVV